MLSKIIKKLALALIIISGLWSCTKSDITLKYETVVSSEGNIIHDIVMYQDSIILFATESKETGNAQIGQFNINSRKTTYTSMSDIIYDIAVSGNDIWACGKDNLLLISEDFGVSWDQVNAFSYLTDPEKSDFIELFVNDKKPLFAIGGKGLLDGNFYYEHTTLQGFKPFLCVPLHMGVSDMQMIDSTEAYITGYGSIMHVQTLNDTIPTYENIGGEDFTAITICGKRTLICCSYSGKIYKKELQDSTWKKTFESGIPLQYIIGDTYGNVMSVGNKRKLCLSNDFGDNWSVVKYASADNITCLSFYNDYFWAGTNKGEIIRFDREQLK